MSAPLSLLVSLLLLLPLSAAGAAPASGELWCVAKNNAEDATLQTALDWACGPGGADCGPIQRGGACFEPEDVQDHASFAFNDYFLRHGSAPDACDFAGAAALTSLNPSQSNCSFPSSSSWRNGSFVGSSTSSIPGLSPDVSGEAKWSRPSIGTLLAVSLMEAGGFWSLFSSR